MDRSRLVETSQVTRFIRLQVDADHLILRGQESEETPRSLLPTSDSLLLKAHALVRRLTYSHTEVLSIGMLEEAEPIAVAPPPTKAKRPSLLGFFKEIFNWYPSEYPKEERK